jgi:hypothetical protein
LHVLASDFLADDRPRSASVFAVRSRQEFDPQRALWETVTHEVARFASSSAPPGSSTMSSLSQEAQDDAFLRELQTMVTAARRSEPVVRRSRAETQPPVAGVRPAPSPASTRKRVRELVWSLRQLVIGDRELVALLAAYEGGADGDDAAVIAGLSRREHAAALGRLKVVCDQLDLLERARPTRH